MRSFALCCFVVLASSLFGLDSITLQQHNTWSNRVYVTFTGGTYNNYGLGYVNAAGVATDNLYPAASNVTCTVKWYSDSGYTAFISAESRVYTNGVVTWDVYCDGVASPTTTNICTASKTLTNPYTVPRKWAVFWVSNAGVDWLWEGYVDPGMSIPMTVSWDAGTGKCPGILRAIGERPGYDTPEVSDTNSSDGTRPIGDPASPGLEDPGDDAGSNGGLPVTNTPSITPGATNFPTLSTNTANAIYQVGNAILAQNGQISQQLHGDLLSLRSNVLAQSGALEAIRTNTQNTATGVADMRDGIGVLVTNLFGGTNGNTNMDGFIASGGGIGDAWGRGTNLDLWGISVPSVGSNAPLFKIPLSALVIDGAPALQDVNLDFGDTKYKEVIPVIRAFLLAVVTFGFLIMSLKILSKAGGV